MAIVGSAELEYLPKIDAAKHQAALQKGVEAPVKNTVGNITKALAGLVVARQVFAIGKESLQSFYEAERVTALLDDRVAHLGETAGVTSEGVEAIASDLQQLAGISDETTKSAATLLLTFTNVRNEVGEGNDVFDQAISGLTDMSIVLGTDASGAALQLGKALNDPIAGITALRRSGVSFTEAQREQIKALVETGDLLGAQKIILSELEKEFGGAAAALGETAAGKAAILSENVGELKESFGAFLSEGLNPVIEGLTSFARLALEAANAQELFADNAGASIANIDAIAKSFLNGTISQEEFITRLQGLAGGLDVATLGIEGAGRVTEHLDAVVRAAAEGSGALEDALAGETAEVESNVLAKKSLIEANEAAAQATRDLLSAELQAAGGLLGAISATRDARDTRQELKEATADLTRIEREGGRGTDEWREARKKANDLSFESIESQAKLESSFVSYGESLEEAGSSQAEAIAKVKELGKAAGASRPLLQGAIDKIKDTAQVMGVLPEATGAAVKAVKRDIGSIPDALRSEVPRARSAGLAVGRAVAQGLKLGLEAGIDGFAASAAAAVNAAEAAAKAAAGAESPSRVFRALGDDIITGLALGIEDAEGKAELAMNRVVDGLVAQGQRFKDQMAGFRSEISGGFEGFGDIIGQFSGDEPFNKEDVRAFLDLQKSQAAAFNKDLRKVIGLGLKKDIAAELAAAGPEGAALADVLADSPGLIRKLNQTDTQIGRLGDEVSGKFDARFFGDKVDKLGEVIAKLGKSIDDRRDVTVVVQVENNYGDEGFDRKVMNTLNNEVGRRVRR